MLKKYLNFWKIIENDKLKIVNKINSEKEFINSQIGKKNIQKLIYFLIIAEDRRFYTHKGFDPIAIIRAIKNKILYNKREGASTIEQQLVRVLTDDYEKSFSRKIREIITANFIKNQISKNESAFIYLKNAYYGTKLNGLDKILEKYNLNLDSKFSDEVCAEIISRLKYPEPIDVNSTKHKLIEIRKKYILILSRKY